MAKDKFQAKVAQWKVERREKQAKESPMTRIREKPKKKRMPVAGKCSPGKVLKNGKCVAKRYIEGPPKKTIAEKYSPGLLAPLVRKRKANLKAAADKKRRDRNMERPAKKKRKQSRTGRQY